MGCCKTEPGLFGSQALVRHYVISQECLECGYVFPIIERDEAAYKVRNVLSRMICPECGALSADISAAIEVTQDRFETWNGHIDYEAKDEATIERCARAIRCAGTA